VGAYEDEKRSPLASTTGGVMTDEAGAVTGDLEVSTRPDSGALHVSVRYVGAEEWYTVTGSPVSLEAGPTPDDLHECVVEHLAKPGPVVCGNEEATSLRDLSLS
jgi:hypothetical protein